MSARASETRVEPSKIWVNWPVVSSMMVLAASVAWSGGRAWMKLEGVLKAQQEQAVEFREMQKTLYTFGSRIDRLEHAFERR